LADVFTSIIKDLFFTYFRGEKKSLRALYEIKRVSAVIENQRPQSTYICTYISRKLMYAIKDCFPFGTPSN